MGSRATCIQVALALLSACGCSPVSDQYATATGDASMSVDATTGTYASSACGQCVATQCATDVTACNGTPDCAAYLSCLDACPVGPDGNVAMSCASACPQATSSSGQQAQMQLIACSTSGAGAACAACSGSSFGTSQCGSCTSQQCGSQLTACHADPACSSYLTCLDACIPEEGGPPDETCAGRCWNASTGMASAALSTLSSCMSSCTTCVQLVPTGVLSENCPPDLDAANACNGCIHDKCCVARLACLDDVNCLALLNCILDCEDGVPDDAGPNTQPPDGGPYSCDEWCSARSNPSLDKWAQIMACDDVLCLSACGGGDACTTCVYQYCSSEYVAVAATPDGYLFDDCIAQCASTDTVCLNGCATSYPSVQAAESALGTCTQQHCPSCN